MTKASAKNLLNDGKKVTHQLFNNNEYLVRNSLLVNNQLYDENGQPIEESKFWAERKSSEWNAGWYVFNESVKYKRRKLYEDIL